MSFAFRKRAPILDTNVARVLLRVVLGRGDAKSHRMRKHLWKVSALMVPHKRAFDFNQGVMDFGALVCTARRPKCDTCPMSGMCRAYPFDTDRSTGRMEAAGARNGDWGR